MTSNTIKALTAELAERVRADLADNGPSTLNAIVGRVDADYDDVCRALTELVQRGRIAESDADQHRSLEDSPSGTMVRFSLDNAR